MSEKISALPAVAHLSFSGDFGGREKVAISLYNSMREAGRTCYLYMIIEERHGADRNENLLSCMGKSRDDCRFFRTNARFEVRVVRELAAQLRKDNVGVFHCHCYKSLFNVLLMRSLGMINGIVVYTLHGLIIKSGFFSTFIKIVQSIGLRRSNGVVGCSREILDSSMGVSDSHRATVIINAIESPEQNYESVAKCKAVARSVLINRWNLDPSKPIVINVGRLCPQKNFPLYLELIESMTASGLNMPNFLLIGNGELEEELKTEAEDRKVKDEVVFTGFVSDMDIVYLGADLLVQTSFWEGTPMCLLEARSYGLPTVAPAVGGNVDVVNDGRDGFMFDSGDLDVLHERTHLYLTDSRLRYEHGRLAFLDVQDRFNPRQWALQHFDFYRTLKA